MTILCYTKNIEIRRKITKNIMFNLTEQTNYGYSSVDISHIELTIETLMILFRERYKLETMEINDVRILYMDLDCLIGKCEFNETQLKVVEMAMEGYTYEDIATHFNWYSEKTTYEGTLDSRPSKKKARSALRSICTCIYKKHRALYNEFNSK